MLENWYQCVIILESCEGLKFSVLGGIICAVIGVICGGGIGKICKDAKSPKGKRKKKSKHNSKNTKFILKFVLFCCGKLNSSNANSSEFEDSEFGSELSMDLDRKCWRRWK